MPEKALISVERIERTILRLRGHNVMLDTDLAALFGVRTKALNQGVRRNSERFPPDFMFQLTVDEAAVALRSQSVTLKTRRGQHRKYRPYAFTEQGVDGPDQVDEETNRLQMRRLTGRHQGRNGESPGVTSGRHSQQAWRVRLLGSLAATGLLDSRVPLG